MGTRSELIRIETYDGDELCDVSIVECEMDEWQKLDRFCTDGVGDPKLLADLRSLASEVLPAVESPLEQLTVFQREHLIAAHLGLRGNEQRGSRTLRRQMK